MMGLFVMPKTVAVTGCAERKENMLDHVGA